MKKSAVTGLYLSKVSSLASINRVLLQTYFNTLYVFSFFVCLYSGWNFGGFIKTIAEKVILLFAPGRICIYFVQIYICQLKSIESAGSYRTSSEMKITYLVGYVDIDLN